MLPFRRVALALSFVGTPAFAHDQWMSIEREGRTARVRLLVGEAPSVDEEKTFERAKFERFGLRSENGTIDLLASGVEGATPIAVVDRLGDGAFLAIAERKPIAITLDAAKFDAYLVEEHLDDVRKARGASAAPGRERYTRHLKSLFWTTDPEPSALATAVVGQKLEIVLGADPATRTAPTTLGVQVLFEGRALTNAHVEASRAGRTVTAKTGADGRASFALDVAGTWVVHLVHMRACAGCGEVDWESAWASYLFALP